MKLNEELTKLDKITARVFILCKLNVQNLTLLFWGLLAAEQILSVGIETLIWGEHFEHMGDTICFILIPLLYLYFLHRLNSFLYKLQTGD